MNESFTNLPEHLLERMRILQKRSSHGNFVMYWLRNAVRAHENPALDIARLLADKLDLPFLVYHALSEHYPFASDRHHTFMLEGALDVQEQFEAMNISYSFHLANPDDRRQHLVELARQAAIVVTEDMPTDPSRHFLNRLLEKIETTVVCVDTACVVPMQLTKKPYTRAFKFRDSTKKLYAERLTRNWVEINCSARPFDLNRLPFEPVNFGEQAIDELVARCEIDHSIGPVADTIGGSSAGYARWNSFRESTLTSYARKRNNALLDGVSRMSAYLHYGMVSPMRIARQAAEMENAGSEKYLDELLIWRELAYTFCFHRQDHDLWSALPEWAQSTLEFHATDHRQDVYTREQLARAKTNDDFWNAAQTSLVMQGELHNNVRMTWGKAILNWTLTPQAALATIIDLNHRFALDGRDPASYGGILWCLGQFDRPFEPEQSVIGTVRPRPTAIHAQRLAPQKFATKVCQPRFKTMPEVAIIGAGISGLFAARTLADHGLPVKVFEKSRGAGGRMSTRRTAFGSFDHGAQYFTVRDPRFRRFVDSWIEQGLVATWTGNEGDSQENRIVVLEGGGIRAESNSVERFVGVPAMNSICKHLAEDLEIVKQTRISNVKARGHKLELFDDEGRSHGTFDRFISSAPAQQTADMLVEFPSFAAEIEKFRLNPCWAAMLVFEKSLTDQWAGAFINDSFLSWAARNSSKPNRENEFDNLVLHAAPDWTSANWQREADVVAREMLEEFWRVSGLALQTPTFSQAHRWKFAVPDEASQQSCLVDQSSKLVACGDWASGSRVEGAFLSGMAAAGRILGTLERRQS